MKKFPATKYKLFTKVIIAFAFCMALFSNKAEASHAMGMDLTYTCLGGNTYQFTLNFYRDCSGVPAPTGLSINVSSLSCGSTNSVPLTLTGPATDISPLCASALSTCNGGSNPGAEHYEYQGTFTLPSNCPDWVFSYSICCRNPSITNLVNPAGQNLYIESKLNNSAGQCNSSPSFTTLPVPYICKDQLINYSLSAFDSDGDSIVYTLINAMGSAGVPLTYVLPYSATYPITTDSGWVVFDSLTGNLNLTPDTTQVCIVTVLVEEYRDSVLIGSVMRDIQVLVLDCPSNLQPEINSPLITNFSGGGVLVDSNSIEVCVGIPVYFDLTASDLDTADTLMLTTNLSTSIPGATFDTTGINPVIGSFSWVPSNNDLGTNVFTVTVQDNFCPIVGKQTYVFEIKVFQGVYAGPDIFHCEPDSIQLNATGSISYTWTPSTGLSNDTISNPMALPDSTTTYIVSGDSTGACSYIDTITINIVPDYVLTLSADTTVCTGDNAQLYSYVNPAGTYTYSWEPASSLIDPSLANPIASPNATTTYTLTATSSDGCVKTGSTTVNLNSLSVSAGSDVVICSGDSTQLNASGGTSYLWSPASGLSNTGIANPVATPTSTTSYIVTVDSACTDTVIVSVDFTTSISASGDTTICGGDTVQINAIGDSIFSWNPSTGLSCTTCPNPMASPSSDITYYVSTPSGCANTDSVVINVKGGFDLTLSSTKDSICAGDTTQLSLSAGCTQPSSIQIGNGTFSSSSYGPFYGSSADVHYQFLYTASELIAAGLTSGNIDNVAFNVLSKLSTSPYQNFQLSMGNTLDSCLLASGGWLPTTPVYGPVNYSTTIGWNSLPFSTPFYWDGTSNIVIETCFDNPDGLGPGGSDNVEYTSGFSCNKTMRNYTNINGSNGCLLTPSFNYTLRGNIQFSCTSSPLDTNITYTWSPSLGLSNQNIANPIASPTSTTTYTVNVDDGGCIVSDSITIYVTPLVTDAGPTLGICAGDSVQLSASSNLQGVSYTWSPGTNLSCTACPLPIATPLDTATYFVTGTVGGCSSNDSVTILVNGTPNASAGPDKTMCVGNSVSITASGGFNYQWAPSSYLDCDTCATVLASPLMDITYTVIVMDSFGCAATDSVFVEVNGVGDLFSTSTKDSICPGDTTQISLNGGCTQTSTIQVGNGTLSNSSYGPFYGNNTDVHYQFIYTASELSAAGLTAGNINNVAFNVLSKLSTSAYENFQLSMGNTSTSCLLASGGWLPTTSVYGPTNYTTTVGWNSFTLTTPFNWDGTSNIVIETCFDNPDGLGPGGLDNIEYTSGLSCDMTMRNYTNTTGSNGCLLTPSFDYPNRANVQFSCTSSPLDTNAIYTWSPSVGLSDPNIANPVANPTATTTYTVSIDDGGCIASDSITIYVTSLVSNAGSDTVLCIGDSIQFSASSNLQGVTYAWSPATNLSCTACPDPFASPTDTTTYYVIGSVGTCTSNDSVTVLVNSIPVADAGLDTNFCYGNSVQLTATGGTSYLWSPSSYTSCTACDKTSVNPPSDMMYYVTVSNAVGCSAMDSVFVEVNGQPITAQSAKPSVCLPGDTTQLFLSGGCSGTNFFDGFESGNYANWTPGISYTYAVTSATSANGNYSLMQTGSGGHFNGLTYTFTPDTPSYISVNLRTEQSSTFNNYFVVGDAGTSGNFGIIFLYALNGNYTLYANTSTATTPYNVGQWYNFEFKNINYTTKTFDYYVDGMLISPSFPFRSTTTVDVSMIYLYNYNSDTSYYDDITIGSVCNSIDSSMIFSWTPGASLSDSAIINPIASPTTTTTYVVSANDQGCINTDTITIYLDTTVVTAYSDTTICAGGSTQLNVTSNTPVASYGWAPSAGLSNSAIANPIASPTVTTSYSVKVTNTLGCQNYDTVTVTVDAQPNAMFSYSANGLIVQFNDTTTGNANLWYWTFGDGGNSTIQDPQHIYTAAGTYQVCLFVQNSCDSSFYCDSITVDSSSCGSSTLAISTNTTASSCADSCDGTTTATVTGGNPSYSYLWNDPNAQTTATATGLCAGDFTLSVTDSSGCTISDSVSVTGPPSLTTLVSNVDTASQGASDGSATVIASGGTLPYTYLWDDPAAQTSATATGLAAGTYTCLVTDANGCTSSVLATVPETTGVGIWDMNLGMRFEVHPNPTDGVIVIDIELLEISDLSIEVMDILGEVVYKRESDNILRYNKETNLSNLANGVYFVKITTKKGSIKKRIVVTR